MVTIVGAAVLAIGIAVAALRNRTSQRSDDRTDEATRDLYRAEDAAHRGEDDNVP
jgi:hypothetical protein